MFGFVSKENYEDNTLQSEYNFTEVFLCLLSCTFSFLFFLAFSHAKK